MAKAKKLQENGVDILPVTHENIVLDNNGVNLPTNYQKKLDSNLTTEEKHIVGAINELNMDCIKSVDFDGVLEKVIPENNITERLERLESLKNNSVSVTQFITDDMQYDHTDAFENAIIYCEENNKSLFIPDGSYYLSRPLIINKDSFSLIGESRNVKLNISHDNYAIIANNHRITIANFHLTPGIPFATYDFNYNGIWYKGSQGNIENIFMYDVNIGILFDTDCWCTNARKLNIYNANNGVIFGENSGSNYLEFDMLAGSSGYDLSNLNNSKALLFEEGTGHHIIGDTGQISGFHYVFDVKNNLDRPTLKIGRVFIEHSYEMYTEDSKGCIVMDETHVASDIKSQNKDGITIFNNNGVNKSIYSNSLKDSAIPVNDLLAYFTFSRNSTFEDKSGNVAEILNTQNLTLNDNKNLFGKSVEIIPTATGSCCNFNIPNLKSKFTIMLSFRQVFDVTNNQLRLFEIISKDKTIENLTMFFVSGMGNNLVLIDNKLNENITPFICNNPPYERNQCIGFSFDLDNGVIKCFIPERCGLREFQDERLKSLNDNFNLTFMRSWSTTMYPLVLNYFAVFDDNLNYEQFLNIYRNTLPLK